MDKQTGKFIARIAENLPDMEGDLMQNWIDDPKELQKFLRGLCLPAFKPAPQPLLIPVGKITIVATTTSFVARDRFVQNTKPNASVKISFLGDNFKEWFLGKTEEPHAGSTLRYDKLSHNSMDAPIIAEFGGEEKAETTLTELFSLMEKQANRESGPLLTNGYWNIFYIKDVGDVLRAVSAYWCGGGWDVRAYAVTCPYPWRGEGQVFSRDSR